MGNQINLSECSDCKGKFPTEFFIPAVIDRDIITGVCPGCILKRLKIIFGDDFEFNTPIAAGILEKYKQYCERNTNAGNR